MKKIIFIIIYVFFSHTMFSQNITESDLIGEWKFIELQDENGIKKTEIPFNRWGTQTIETVNRDSYIFYENGEYKSYNPLNVSTGTWFFNKKTNEINFELRFNPDDPYLPQLKEVGIVSKRDDGFYYQKPIKIRILKYSENEIIIADREQYVLIYIKK